MWTNKYTLQVLILWSLNRSTLVELVLMCSMCLDRLDIHYSCLWYIQLDSHNWHICPDYLAYNWKLTENLFLVLSDSQNLLLVLVYFYSWLICHNHHFILHGIEFSKIPENWLRMWYFKIRKYEQHKCHQNWKIRTPHFVILITQTFYLTHKDYIVSIFTYMAAERKSTLHPFCLIFIVFE